MRSARSGMLAGPWPRSRSRPRASPSSRYLPTTRGRGAFWLMAAAGMIGGAYRSRLQTVGYDNVLMPAHAVLAILAALAVADAFGALRDARRPLAEVAISAACLAQLALLAYDPRA